MFLTKLSWRSVIAKPLAFAHRHLPRPINQPQASHMAAVHSVRQFTHRQDVPANSPGHREALRHIYASASLLFDFRNLPVLAAMTSGSSRGPSLMTPLAEGRLRGAHFTLAGSRSRLPRIKPKPQSALRVIAGGSCTLPFQKP